MGRKKGMSIHQLSDEWKQLIVGQDMAIDRIVPYIVRAQANLNSPNKPIGVFFLMGPTGTGKTKTAESLAELLHGSERNVLRVDCGEFQMEHEVAKMIGAPPGYLGHRETQPLFTQQKLGALSTDKCPFNIILFDEIEKAHPGFWRAILNILDKAVLRLGDNSVVNFEKSIIFLSSNVGAKEIGNLLAPSFGFSEASVGTDVTEAKQKAIEKIGMGAMTKKFPPEFANRVDEIITYRSLNQDILHKITDMELKRVQNHIIERLGTSAFTFAYDLDTIDFITTTGTSVKYGARELKRALGRYVLNPLADDYVEGKISSGSTVRCKVVNNDHIEWDINELPTELMDETEMETAAAAGGSSETTVTKKSRKAKSTT
jgi:ATP-dependent Clp protease ATP-binding subunit ClpA